MGIFSDSESQAYEGKCQLDTLLLTSKVNFIIEDIDRSPGAQYEKQQRSPRPISVSGLFDPSYGYLRRGRRCFSGRETRCTSG